MSLTALANSEMCRSKVEAETDPVIYEHRRGMGWLKFRQTHQNIGIPGHVVQPQGFVEHEVARADIQPKDECMPSNSQGRLAEFQRSLRRQPACAGSR